MIKTGLSGVLERQSRPAHVGIPRKRIEPTFAIQMMRNSYNVVDDMDFVAMDEFQRTFFLFRLGVRVRIGMRIVSYTHILIYYIH